MTVHDGAKLHFSEKQMKLTENEENEKPVLAAHTTARGKGTPDMEKILKTESPGKKLRDQKKVKPIQSQKKTIDSCALQAPIIVSWKRREEQQKTVT